MIPVFISFAFAKAPVPLLVDWSSIPRLPAPKATMYEAVPGRPEDRAVASLVSGRRWDSTLSGAAVGIALFIANGNGRLTAPALRQAAQEAGWPYPIASARTWSGGAGEPPPAAVNEWLASVPGDASIGLVRARDGNRDIWVGLSSTVRADIGAVPRQLPVGGRLRLPAVPGAEVWIADPAGRLDRGGLDIAYSRTTEAAGEWLIEVRDPRGRLASFPVYVGMVPPNLRLLVPSPLPSEVSAADALVLDRLEDIRSAYGRRPFETDLLLQAAADSVAGDRTIDVRAIAPQLGTTRDDVWQLDCESSTVEGCLDEILWDVRARPGLLASRALLGRNVRLTSNGIRVILVVAREG